MKIAHVSYVPNMFDSFQNHMINMCQLEGSCGIRSEILPSIYFFNDDVPTGYDLIHIHGIPSVENSLEYMNFIKNLYLNRIKFVISIYNYLPICQYGIMQDINRENCNFLNCNNDICNKSKNIFEFIKNCNLFVYSNPLKNVLEKFGCQKVNKIPICIFNDDERFIFKEKEKNKSVGYFRIEDSIFDKENMILNQIENSEKQFRFVNISYDSKNPNISALFVPNMWDSVFEYETAFALSLGIQVIANKDFQSEEFKKYVEYIDFDNVIEEIDNAIQNLDSLNFRKMSYDYWNLFGPHTCLSYYDSYYRKFINEN